MSSLAQIAAESGVSVSTASRALRGKGEMTPQTRARVLAVAQQYGYSTTGVRRGRPRTGTSHLFDLVLGRFHDPYADEVTAGAHLAAARHRFDLVLTAERDTPDDDWPLRIRARGSAGVVLGLILPTAAQLAVLRDAGIPLVLMDPRAEAGASLTSVRTTDRAGAAAAAEHLLEAGAKQFVVVDAAPSYRFGRARVEGFEAAVRSRHPTAVIHRVRADWSSPGAWRASLPALREAAASAPIGVFAISDEMAIGVYRAAADLGMRVGQDVLVVGFDDVRGAKWVQPALTTVRQPIRDMAGAAIDELVAIAAGADPQPRIVELPTTLVVRGSTGAPAASPEAVSRESPRDRPRRENA
ncbi:LacI family DNA-binding transcriptional regulator [Microbacterium sp.]|uniref:LacI family DNA-binding transcriptional regulator n=1 Tax=Microbacterium sp. TaxID=51671 RepID=UPI002621879D|nr:LacI family DNA-binding transcriptional regulator [Microbacterium sp.]